MAETLYVCTFKVNSFGPYRYGESAAFNSYKAVPMFCDGIVSLTDEDQSTLAAQITAYQTANNQNRSPVNPSTVGTNPDGGLSGRY